MTTIDLQQLFLYTSHMAPADIVQSHPTVSCVQHRDGAEQEWQGCVANGLNPPMAAICWAAALHGGSLSVYSGKGGVTIQHQGLVLQCILDWSGQPQYSSWFIRIEQGYNLSLSVCIWG